MRDDKSEESLASTRCQVGKENGARGGAAKC